MTNLFRLILLFFILLFLVGCVPMETAVLPTVAATRVVATAVSATLTPTPLPSTTPSPTPSSIPSPTPSRTPPPTPSRTPAPTALPRATPLPTPRIIADGTSPDGQWKVTLETRYLPGEQVVERFWVMNTGEEGGWLAEETTFGIDDWFAPHPKTLHWSADGRYFYFTHTPFGDGCYPSSEIPDLYRLELSTGDVVPLFTSLGYGFSISPDDQQVAYVSQSTLFVANLFGGEVKETPLAVAYETSLHLSQLTWSPDGRYLLLEAVIDPCVVEPWMRTLLLVDTNTLAQTMALPQSATIYHIVEWPSLETAVLETSDKLWWLNPFTGVLQPTP